MVTKGNATRRRASASASEMAERERAEIALQESEERYRLLVENALDAIYTFSLDGTITSLNPAFETITGWPRAEWLGKHFASLIHPDDLPGMMEAFDCGLRGVKIDLLQARILAKSGEYVAMEFRGTPLLRNGELVGFLGIGRDVTERKRAEEALHESERRFREIFDNVRDEIVLIQPNGVIADVNDRVWDIFGYHPHELIGRNVMDIDFFDSDELSRLSGLIQDHLAQGVSPDALLEVQAKHKDSHTVPVEASTRLITDEDGSPKGFVNIIRDITERKRMEEELRKAHDDLEIRVKKRTSALAKANEELRTEIHERERAEAALRDSEKRYRLLAENVTDGIVSTDMNLRATYVSPSFSRLLGYSIEESMTRTVEESLTPASREVALEAMATEMAIEQKKQGNPTRLRMRELEFYRKDGSTAWLEVTVSFVRDEDGRPVEIVNALRDVTERRKAEEALRESEEHYSALVENLSDAVFKFKGGVVVWCNDRAEQIYGFTKKQLIGKDAGFFLPEDVDTHEFIRSAYAAIEEHGAFHSTAKARKKDGSTLDIEYSIAQIPGKYPIELVAVARDITERVKMEEALRESEKKLRLYLESSPDAIYINDSRGTFHYGNRAAERIIGYSKKQLTGKSFLELDILPPEYLAKAARTLELNMAGKPTGPDEFELVRKDGSRVFVEISTFPVGKGDEIEVIGIARDISERKRAEHERERLEQQLQLSGRLAAVGELAAGVAHELNNPLAAVQGFAQLVTSRRDLDASLKGDVEAIYREAQRATRITSNLLSFARRYKPEKTFISINEVVEKSLELHAYRMRVNNIDVNLQLDADLPNTMADFHQMEQVFVNLITNAEHAMTEAHGKGTLTLKTQKAGQTIRITFADDGPGIPDEDLKRVFDPFFTTKGVGRGTGLGLSICYGIVQEHGGQLHATSEPGKGATLVVEIPVVSENQPVEA